MGILVAACKFDACEINRKIVRRTCSTDDQISRKIVVKSLLDFAFIHVYNRNCHVEVVSKRMDVPYKSIIRDRVILVI